MIACTKKKGSAGQEALRFPWILWQVWKARNSFFFENRRHSSEKILSKADDDAITWLQVQKFSLRDCVREPSRPGGLPKWKAPPWSMLKCNIGASWRRDLGIGGASWIIRDSRGKALSHSRRAYSGISSPLEADLVAILWAIESMRSLKMSKVIFEILSLEAYERITSPQFSYESCSWTANIARLFMSGDNCHITCGHLSENKIANKIAVSVTRDRRF